VSSGSLLSGNSPIQREGWSHLEGWFPEAPLALVVQLVEPAAHNGVVVGSSPARRTILRGRRMSKKKDDHPVRTIFLETVAEQTKLPVKIVRKRLKKMTTDYMDRHWPIFEAIRVVQH
jgi:hypothetical protein